MKGGQGLRILIIDQAQTLVTLPGKKKTVRMPLEKTHNKLGHVMSTSFSVSHHLIKW